MEGGKYIMNSQLVAFARSTIKTDLSKLSPAHHNRFKQMYARGKGGMNKPINQVVDEMEPHLLDWAMQQVENTLKKIEVDNELTAIPQKDNKIS